MKFYHEGKKFVFFGKPLLYNLQFQLRKFFFGGDAWFDEQGTTG